MVVKGLIFKRLILVVKGLILVVIMVARLCFDNGGSLTSLKIGTRA